MRLAILFALLFATAALGQDALPQRIDTVTASHVVCLLSSSPSSNYAVAWLNSGFGRINSTGAAPVQVSMGVPYTFFKITSPANGPSDDYWICPTSAWDSYVLSNNVSALRSVSLNFSSFQLSSSYVPPTLNEPVTWEDRTPMLTIGYTSANTLLVVRKQGTAWEWSVRGTNGSDVWTQSASKDTAKAAAAATLPQ